MSSPFSNGKKRKLSSKLPKTSTIQQPKAGTKSTELEQSLAQGSDILTDRHETVEEPAAIVGEASGASNEGQQNLNVNMNAEDLTKVLTDHTKDLSTHWEKQLSALTKAVETTRLTPTFPSGNSVPLPKFSGDCNEEVNEFLANFNRTARFYKFSEDRKVEILPLYLTGNASIWYNTTPGLSGKIFDTLAEALKKHFHSDSDVWLLRQTLNERKQLATESVSEFAAGIRRLGQRINLPRTECINYFFQGLKSELKSFVILQRPTSFEEAEMHAKLKESVPEPKPVDRTDEILKALAHMQQTAASRENSSVAEFDRYENTHSKPVPGERPVTRDDIARIVQQQIRQEMRRNSRFSGQNMRGRRTFDGRPICDFCNKPGHIVATCRQGRDPRIPNAPRGPTQSWGRPQYSSHTGNQNLN